MPAFEKFEYKVIRADNIGKPGMITNQIIDYIMNAAFVVCDLSYHNPNVFYELALRHVLFEKCVARIFQKAEYSIQRNVMLNNGVEIDIIAEKDDNKYCPQLLLIQ